MEEGVHWKVLQTASAASSMNVAWFRYHFAIFRGQSKSSVRLHSYFRRLRWRQQQRRQGIHRSTVTSLSISVLSWVSVSSMERLVSASADSVASQEVADSSSGILVSVSCFLSWKCGNRTIPQKIPSVKTEGILISIPYLQGDVIYDTLKVRYESIAYIYGNRYFTWNTFSWWM